MTQDQRFPTSFTRRRFLQYSGAAAGSAALGSSFLAACAGGSSGGGYRLKSIRPVPDPVVSPVW